MKNSLPPVLEEALQYRPYDLITYRSEISKADCLAIQSFLEGFGSNDRIYVPNHSHAELGI